METMTIMLLTMIIVISSVYLVASSALELFYRKNTVLISETREEFNRPRTNGQLVISVFLRLIILGSIYYGSVHIVELRELALGAYFSYLAMHLIVLTQCYLYANKVSRVYVSLIYTLFVSLMFYPLFGG